MLVKITKGELLCLISRRLPGMVFCPGLFRRFYPMSEGSFMERVSRSQMDLFPRSSEEREALAVKCEARRKRVNFFVEKKRREMAQFN